MRFALRCKIYKTTCLKGSRLCLRLCSKPRNDGDWLANSTMMGIMGRMAAYTGKDISWEQATSANDSVAPLADISFNDKPPVAELPQPGKTRIG